MANDPIINKLKTGSPSDPYTEFNNVAYKVNSGKVELSEIPDENARVRVSDPVGNIIYSETQSKFPGATQYQVDYVTGILSFNPLAEGKTLAFTWKGRGVTYFPASRIWTIESNGQVTETLKEIIDNAKVDLENLHDLSQIKDEAIEATENANEAANSVNTAIVNADTATANANSAASAANSAKENADIATINANDAASNANTAATNANDAATSADNAATAANAATANVEEAIEDANAATSNANDAVYLANTAAANTNNAITQLVHRGEYNNSTTYFKNNSVRYNGSSYKCIQDSTGNLPINLTYWELEALRGQDGTGAIASITSTNGDIDIGGTAQDITLTINTGTGSNQIVKRDSDGNIPDVLTVQTDLNDHIGSGGSSHADVVAGGASGFMSGADKTKLETLVGRVDQDVRTTASPTFVKVKLTGDAQNMLGEVAPGRMVLRGKGGTTVEGEVVTRLQANAYHDGTSFQRWNPANWSLMLDLHSVDNRLQLLRAKPGSGAITAWDYQEIIPTSTATDVTYYVRPDGNDNNNGLANTAAGAFKTIQKAIDTIPQVVNHVVTINVAQGQYLENVYVKGFTGKGSINILGDTAIANFWQLYSVTVDRCSCFVYVRGFKGEILSAPSFVATASNDVLFEYCNVAPVKTTSHGFYALLGSNIRVFNCTAHNKDYGVFSEYGARVWVYNTAGSANTYGLGATRGAIISVEGTSPNGTSAKESVSLGGIIQSKDGNYGVINPWGDNTRTARPYARISANGAGDALTLATVHTWYKLPMSFVQINQRSTYDATNKYFLVPETGHYIVSVSAAFANLSQATRVMTGLFINGGFQFFMGDSQKVGIAQEAVVLYGSTAIHLDAGQTVDIRAHSSTTPNVTYDVNGAASWVSIIRVA